jgi:hypothetical protein
MRRCAVCETPDDGDWHNRGPPTTQLVAKATDDYASHQSLAICSVLSGMSSEETGHHGSKHDVSAAETAYSKTAKP